MTVDQAKLYATTDARVWAQEWCKIAREIEEADDDRQVIDEGWMIGWFANAIENAKIHEQRRLRAEIDELHVRSIGERNPGIDLDEVRRYRASVSDTQVKAADGTIGPDCRES
jgi:hypothetical protein